MEAMQATTTFYPLYVVRNEANIPVFYLEFTKPDYSAFEASFLDHETHELFYETMEYVSKCLAGEHPFDYDTFLLLLDTDCWAYLNLIGKNRRDDIPKAYIRKGQLLQSKLKRDLSLLHDFLKTGELRSMKHRLEVQRLLQLFLDDMGWECFCRKLPYPPMDVNEEPALKKYATIGQLNLPPTLIETEECVFVTIGNTTIYLLKLEDRPIVWLRPANIS